MRAGPGPCVVRTSFEKRAWHDWKHCLRHSADGYNAHESEILTVGRVIVFFSFLYKFVESCDVVDVLLTNCMIVNHRHKIPKCKQPWHLEVQNTCRRVWEECGTRSERHLFPTEKWACRVFQFSPWPFLPVHPNEPTMPDNPFVTIWS